MFCVFVSLSFVSIGVFTFVSVFFSPARCASSALLPAPRVSGCSLVMQEDTNFPFGNRARPVAPFVDLVYHIFQIRATMSIGFHHVAAAAVANSRQKKPCGTRALYQRPLFCCLLSIFFLPALPRRSRSLKMSVGILRDVHREINTSELQTSVRPGAARLLGFFNLHMHFLGGEGRGARICFLPEFCLSCLEQR